MYKIIMENDQSDNKIVSNDNSDNPKSSVIRKGDKTITRMMVEGF